MNERNPRPASLAASLAERRRFLKGLGAAAVTPLLGAGAAAAALPDWSLGGSLGAAPAVAPGPGGVFLVNGWVLTGADLGRLGLRAASAMTIAAVASVEPSSTKMTS